MYSNNKGEKKALTDKKYYEISEFFQKKFGKYAGWAHSYLFTADLARFKGDIKEKPAQKRKAIELTSETMDSAKPEKNKQTKKTPMKRNSNKD
jgi:hypothetical protein